MKDWSNLARIVYKRTYARKTETGLENWEQTINRVVQGNVRGHNVPEQEVKQLIKFGIERKATCAGRGLWFSGSPSHEKLGGTATVNCWFLTADNWNNFVIAEDLLMLGGGVGMSVEHRFSSKLPKVKKNVKIVHKATKDADYIVPDSREGWCYVIRDVLEAFFETGKSFSYSTVCLRGYGEPINGFGGVASGPMPLIECIETLSSILNAREGKSIRPIDAADITTAIAQMVVSGNVRRSAIIILGDSWDKEYLKAKRWDLQTLPKHRARANYSVVCDDVDDFHPLFWKTYEQGEPFGIINRTNIQKYGRMGEVKKDTAVGTNPCVIGSTEILTDKGYFPIENLTNQEINVWNGIEWSTVRPVITGQECPIVKVVLSSGQELTCTPYHAFVLSVGPPTKRRNVKVKAQDLRIGDKLARFDMPVVDAGISFEQAYTQGFISAEGMDDYGYFYVYDTKRMCLNRLSVRKTAENDGQHRLRCYPSFDKRPKEYVPTCEWNIESRLNWLAGLVDGDGCSLTSAGIQISSNDERFLKKVQKMLTTVGVISKVSLSRVSGKRILPDGRGGSKQYSCSNDYRLLIGETAVQHLLMLGFHCERVKFKKQKATRPTRFVQVKSVVSAGIASTVYCFTDHKNGTGCFEGIVTGQCGEACLENGEPCNLLELALCNLKDINEFETAARLMMRFGKRTCLQTYHHAVCDEVIKRNMRVGIGITGCLSSPLFAPEHLDRVYQAIREEDTKYSKELGVTKSIRRTVVKPSGTLGKVFDCNQEEGIHAALAPYIIQRVQFSSNDPLIPLLKNAGHHIEPLKNFDGTVDPRTMVADFYVAAPEGAPTVETGWDTWKQLEAVKTAQKYWADQSVSVTVYYKEEEIPKVKDWLSSNLNEIKTISFLKYSGHGFLQAPKEPITKEQYETLSAKIKPLDMDQIMEGEINNQECEGGVCPVK